MAPAWLPATNQLEEQAHLLQKISQCADHSKPGLLHGAILLEAEADSWLVRLEARDKTGFRLEAEDLELEIYGSAQIPRFKLAGFLIQINHCFGLAAIRYGWIPIPACSSNARKQEST